MTFGKTFVYHIDMTNISGPCLVIIKNGEPFNKYEVVATETTPLCITTEVFYFDNKDDAELYVLYLQREAGLDDIEKLLRSDRTFLWEKREYEEFMKTIDWDEYKNKVKDLKFEYHKEIFRRNKK